MLKHILRTDLHGDPNLGLFALATDKFILAGSSMQKKAIAPLEEVLKTGSHRILVADTDLVGLFVAANANGVVVPKIMEDDELRTLKRLADQLDLNVLMLKTKETALGNLILANDRGCIISKELHAVKSKIADALGVETEIGSIAGLDTVGSCGIATNRGVLVHRGCSERELEHIERVLHVRGDIGSVAFGSPFVGAGVLANSNGFAASRSTTGPELQRIDEALGFTESI
ncbi:MAG: translation initiation factor IF-6 [Candidatus Aenigmatarchaeota archaeon]|nr:MAG: translation initiation factor IF-6 [Candidatus Aenigmarchaeota archaeon]